MDTAFPQFQRLPPELQSLVWTFTLCDADQPTLFIYSDRWVTQFLDDPNPDDDDDDGENALEHVDLKPYVQVHIPIVHVNREARRVGLRWASQRGIQMKLDPDSVHHPEEEEERHPESEVEGGAGGAHVFVREWDRRRDSLLIPRNRWRSFLDLATDHPELWRRIGAAVHHLALPAFTAYYGLETLAEFLEVAPNIEKVYIVWGETPETVMLSARTDRRQQQQEDKGGGAGDYWQADEDEDGREREVQPRWVLETEDAEEVQMYVKDREGSSHISEWGSLEEYLIDIADMMTTIEWPRFLVDGEARDLKLPLVNVRAVRESKVDGKTGGGSRDGEDEDGGLSETESEEEEVDGGGVEGREEVR